MKLAWENIQPLDLDVASMDTSSQFVQIVPGNDTVVLILLEMQMGEHRGAMSVCIPYLLIKPILGKLSAQRWLTNTSKKPSPLFAAGLADRLRTTRVPCVARLGTADITVDALAALEVGQILTMRIPSATDEEDDGAARGRHRHGRSVDRRSGQVPGQDGTARQESGRPDRAGCDAAAGTDRQQRVELRRVELTVGPDRVGLPEGRTRCQMTSLNRQASATPG